jgi:hypothetical protein
MQTIDTLIDAIAERLHADEPIQAAKIAADALGVPFDATDSAGAYVVLNSLLHWVLNRGRYDLAARLLWSEQVFSSKPYAARLVWETIAGSSSYLLMGAASMSKCLGLGTLVRMSDGTTKRVEDVVVGDTLTGDDGGSRRVLTTTRGSGQLFRITPEVGDSWVCNGDHVLTLRCTYSKFTRFGRISGNNLEGTVIDIPVRDFIAKSSDWKRRWGQFEAPAPMPEQPVPFDPYLYGAWLADGTSGCPIISKPVGSLTRRWTEYFESLGASVSVYDQAGTDCKAFRVCGEVGGRLKTFVESSVRDGEKRIRSEYLRNSLAVRRSLLAGLLDGDGSPSCGGFVLITKYPGLRDDVLDLARSVGLRASTTEFTSHIKHIGFSGQYHRIGLSGDFSQIPTIQKFVDRKTARGLLGQRFEVTDLGQGDYAGFSIDGNHRFLLGSGVVTHNSYAGGAWHLLDWIRDPEFTTVRVVGPSENHLEENLFSHLVRMHRESRIPLPGTIGKLFIGLDSRQQSSSIAGIIIPPGKKGGRLQGMKRLNRRNKHPVFGTQTRLRFFIDEMEKVPPGIWKDIDNVFSNVDLNPEGFKIGGAFNPEDPNGPCGVRCEPVNGWGSVDRDKDDRWSSVRGWEVCRLNAMKSENVVEKRKIYPGLQTYDGVQRIVQNAGGWEAAGVYTMVYALFPPKGMVSTVVGQDLINDVKRDLIWTGPTTPIGGVDVALEGGDTAYFAAGRCGLASGYKTLDGKVTEYRSTTGSLESRPSAQLDQLFALPSGNSVEVASSIRNFATQLAIEPANLVLDRTGNGAGVHDILRVSWDMGVVGVNYSENATQTKILWEDSKTPYDEYDRLVTELWFAVRKWLQAKSLSIGPFVATDKVFQELTSRQYSATDRAKKARIESKKEYKDRSNGLSPDQADALTLFIHAARKAVTSLPSVTGAGNQAVTDSGGERRRPKVSVTDRLDSIDD